MPAIYPDNFEQKIGFDRIRLMLKGYCISNLGQEHVDSIGFMSTHSEIDLQTEYVVEFLRIIRLSDGFPTSHIYDLRPALAKARVEGTYLEVQEVFNLKRSLESLRGMINFFNASGNEQYPNLKKLAGNVGNFNHVVAATDRILTKHGTVKDNASPELQDIRSSLFGIQSTISRKMQSILRHLQTEGIVDEDTTVSIRDGRPVIPVAAANKKKINGIVHDESATGKTSFIEPAEIVELNNRLRELENAERREIIRILVNFTIELRPNIDDLEQAYLFMGVVDFIRAKALFANEYDCAKPTIKNEPFFDWHNARHPLLMQTLRREKREVVPLALRMDDPNRILLISGPNAGGKSVCLKTVGIIQYMLQCGLLVPISDGASMGLFNSIFIDIGDEQSIDNDLSTYSSHLLNMKFFVRNCSPKTLVLIDEFGTGTEPMLGGAIAESVLNKLNQLGTYGVITTHYTNLKHFASSTKGLVNGAMLYDSNGMKPLFKLQIGSPGSSFAFEIARKIGLPEDILQEATDKLGRDYVDYDKHLKHIVRDKQYWENKRLRIRKVERDLDELNDKYLSELEQTKKKRAEIIAEAKQEAKQLLDQTNKLIENTIREIRESQAEKMATRDIRKRFTEQKVEVEKTDEQVDASIQREIDKINRRKTNKDKRGKNEGENVAPQPVPAKKVYQPGDKVVLKSSGSIAEIIDIDGSKVVLALGNLVTTVQADKIEPVGSNEAKRLEKEQRNVPKADSIKRTNDLMNKKLEFKPDIDIRGQRAEEAIGNIQQFIDEAIMVGASRVRILHGKGYGILKEVIRNYLRSEPLVKSIADEMIQLGGAGITVVELDH